MYGLWIRADIMRTSHARAPGVRARRGRGRRFAREKVQRVIGFYDKVSVKVVKVRAKTEPDVTMKTNRTTWRMLLLIGKEVKY
jgi:hypothetical protein